MKNNETNIAHAQHPCLVMVPIASLSPAPEGQARRHFDAVALQTLAASMSRSGVRTPILVTPDATMPGHYRVVAGERRWRAAQLAGLTELPCLVDERLGDRSQRLLAQAEENLHRQDLNVVEEAAVLVQLMDAFKVGAQEAGALVGRSYQQARRLIQLHNAPQSLRDAIVQRHIDARAALELVRIHNRLAQDPSPDGKRRAAAQLEDLIDRVVNERWTIRRLEQYARKLLDGTVQSARPTPPHNHGPGFGSVRSSGSTSRLPTATARTPPFRRSDDGVFIDTHRIARREVSPEEREELIKILEELLMAVRRI